MLPKACQKLNAYLTQIFQFHPLALEFIYYTLPHTLKNRSQSIWSYQLVQVIAQLLSPYCPVYFAKFSHSNCISQLPNFAHPPPLINLTSTCEAPTEDAHTHPLLSSNDFKFRLSNRHPCEWCRLAALKTNFQQG